jgi:DNA polymerase-3 subunit beta
MKFTCEAKAFSAALAFAGRVIPTKTPWPILSCLKIVTNDSRITLIGSNADVTFEMQVSAAVLTEGVTCLPFDPLSKFVAAAKGGTVEVEETPAGIVVKSGRGRIVLSASDVRDYPNYTAPEGDAALIDGPTLRKALSFAVAAASTEEVKYYLCGANVRQRDGALEICGTDGHGMHLASIADGPDIGAGGILPTEAVGIIVGLLDKCETAHLYICERGWHVVAGPIRAFGKVIDGQFPDVHRVLDGMDAQGGWQSAVVGKRDDIVAAITVASCGADTTANKARSLVIRGTEGQPVIARGWKGTSGVITAGRAEMEARAACTFSGVINASLLSRAIGGIDGDDLAIQMNAASGAFRVDPAQGSATMTMLAVIMGIRASEAEMADAA